MLFFCVASFALCLSNVAYGAVVYKKNITICKDNVLPLDLSKAIGISLPPDRGVWVDEDGKLISNIFILPENNELRYFKFKYVLTTNSFCGLYKDDELELKINISDEFVIYLGDLTQPTCDDPSGTVELKDYDPSLSYVFIPKGPIINSSGVIEYAQPGVNYSVYSTDGICASEIVHFEINDLPDDCNLVPCDQLWKNIIVNQLISPNNDGLNDVLIIEGLKQFYKQNCNGDGNKVDLLIFNRWGTLVYNKENYMKDEERFDGFSSNQINFIDKKRLPAGTYFYILRAEGRDSKNGYLYVTGYN